MNADANPTGQPDASIGIEWQYERRDVWYGADRPVWCPGNAQEAAHDEFATGRTRAREVVTTYGPWMLHERAVGAPET